MADLTVDGKTSDKEIPVKTKQTERKPTSLDKPQEVTENIQIHQGNIGVLTVKLLGSINMVLHNIYRLMLEKNK